MKEEINTVLFVGLAVLWACFGIGIFIALISATALGAVVGFTILFILWLLITMAIIVAIFFCP